MARILIADDDDDYRDIFCEGMEFLGHSVTGYSNGAGMLQDLEDNDHDIVFLDVVMEGGGAITLVHAVRAVKSHVPVVIITGRTELIESPLFSEGLRQAQAKIPKTTTLSELDRLVRALTKR